MNSNNIFHSEIISCARKALKADHRGYFLCVESNIKSQIEGNKSA